MALTQSLTSGSTIHAVDLDSKALGTIPDEDHGVVIRKVLAETYSLPTSLSITHQITIVQQAAAQLS